MNICIRVDASSEIGTGHVMRCLTLAEELKMHGAQVSFISRDLQGNLIDYVAARSFMIYPLEPPISNHFQVDNTIKHASWLAVDTKTDVMQTKSIIEKQDHKVDWLIIDHYGIGEEWERQLRPSVNKIMVIDDLADRAHDCDVLLDQNYYGKMYERYKGLVPNTCVKLLGPGYALLRPEFKSARKYVKERDGKIKRILIFFGGSDPTDETTKAIEAIRKLNKPNISIDVVTGKSNKNIDKLRLMCKELEYCTFHCQIDYMAKLMAEADLSIGAGGSTTWERCYLGLPTIVVITADNQEAIVRELEKKGCGWCLGKSQNVTTLDILNKLKKILNTPSIVKEVSYLTLAVMKEVSKSHSVVSHLIWGRKI
ncbi:UDP-2,4-diacetamido-2,4,6-trideoxy-beta-L-altropyranose hydrolase [Halalkalibacter okhensis]|uniref:Glycosyl transferase family 28 C-terminal domain-containing protein n=1 Tax=Halalkalibacter okhensis TaxID=333138 RepID=A0A0B0IGB8_9BACI|nr:UDP-2,4-diacetamido-2,4,6-trideoxy-beta-L-altropyranose hydrolase [Halalkalibacter okhensis]KHF39877.1 hypothetical protein LQ50_12490 [Halalkalibacter okhensis]